MWPRAIFKPPSAYRSGSNSRGSYPGLPQSTEESHVRRKRKSSSRSSKKLRVHHRSLEPPFQCRLVWPLWEHLSPDMATLETLDRRDFYYSLTAFLILTPRLPLILLSPWDLNSHILASRRHSVGLETSPERQIFVLRVLPGMELGFSGGSVGQVDEN